MNNEYRDSNMSHKFHRINWFYHANKTISWSFPGTIAMLPKVRTSEWSGLTLCNALSDDLGDIKCEMNRWTQKIN